MRDERIARGRGLSVRLRLTLSYAGFLMVAGVLLLAVVWVYLLRYVPEGPFIEPVFTPSRGDLQRAFLPKAALAMGALLVFGLVGGWMLAGWMLAPLTRITDAARLAADGSLSHRIRLRGRRDELSELADTFDAMLARIEAQVEEQKRFAANASHELRTPLAITQTLLEVARSDRSGDHEVLVDRLHSVNARAIDLTEALLLLSRADQRSFAREQVDLSLVAEEAAETLLALAEQRGVAVETAGTEAVTPGSPALLLQLVVNLVHNAVVHNLPEAGSVRITTGPHGRQARAVELRVENTGPVLSPGLVATLAEPFRRGSERIRSGHDGVGLGLAIVKSIVQAHDGTLTLAPRAGGGLVVTVVLPPAG